MALRVFTIILVNLLTTRIILVFLAKILVFFRIMFFFVWGFFYLFIFFELSSLPVIFITLIYGVQVEKIRAI
jgi:hypothetical protein